MLAQAVQVLLLATFALASTPARAADEECDPNSTLFKSPADNLCVPAMASNVNFDIDGDDREWAANTYYDHTEYGGFRQARVRISRKATGVGKSDLFLFFDVGGDFSQTCLDEIRIGLNPTIAPGNTTLIKIHPFPDALPGSCSAPPPLKETFTFNSGTGTWTSAGSGDAWLPPANIAADRDIPDATWTTEVKISLDTIPDHPITGDTFRLYLELISHDDPGGAAYFQWPQQPVVLSPLHDFICSNPNRYHPMSFATGAGGNCPHQDLSIANGLYSCNDVYVLRNGAKSQEIAVNQQNEFHADVANPGPGDAPNAEVYLTLLQLGTSTAPLAANYDPTKPAIVDFFSSKYGAWMTATDKLDTGSPTVPPPFSVSVPKDTAARFTWRPSDETRFGPPANFVATHKCTAAFVNFKDDPNFANNFSYCNTSIVNCPTGQICPLSFWVGQIYPYFKPVEGARTRLVVSAINEPFPGWLEQAQLRLEGEGLERIRENIFEIRLPATRNVPLKLSIVPPRQERPEGDRRPGSDRVSDAERGVDDAVALKAGGNPGGYQDARLRELYGRRPLIVIQNLVPTALETGPDGTRVQLYVPTSYVAFAVGAEGRPHGCCGRAKGSSYVASAIVALLGLGLVWRRLSHPPKGACSVPEPDRDATQDGV